ASDPEIVESDFPWVSAQTTRSTPASASARAWATRSWLLAMVGSLLDNRENATTRTDRMRSASMAITRAIPRSSRKDPITFRFASLTRGVASGIPGKGRASIGKTGLVLPFEQPHGDERDTERHRGVTPEHQPLPKRDEKPGYSDSLRRRPVRRARVIAAARAQCASTTYSRASENPI